MTEIRFYHLTRSRLEEALPQILLKSRGRDMRSLLVTKDEERVKFWNEHLWRFDEHSFLPHGSKSDGEAIHQPVWITHEIENENEAQLLILTDGVEHEACDDFDLVCYFFNGLDEMAVGQARTFWKALKDKSHSLSYWQQSENGSWKERS